MEEEKHFEEWINLKEKLHFGKKMPRIREGEVWWCSFGENIGVEINGKSDERIEASLKNGGASRIRS